MKSTFLLAGLALTCVGGVAHADWEDGYTFMKFMANRPVALNLEGVKTEDDYLVELARAGDLNIIADVTSVAPKPFDESVYPPYQEGLSEGQAAPILQRALETYQLTNKLAERRSDLHTLLYWERPDGVALGRKLLSYQPKAPRGAESRAQALEAIREFKAQQEAPPNLRTVAQNGGAETDYLKWQSARLTAPLRRYYQRTYDWGGGVGDFNRRVLMSELPAPLRQEIMTTLRERAYSEDNQKRLDVYKMWMSDEFWQSARVWVETDPKAPGALWVRVGLPGANNSELQKTIDHAPRVVARDKPAIPRSTLESWQREAGQVQAAQTAVQDGRDEAPGVGARISLEAKHQTLKNFLAAVQTQSGVTLAAAPAIAENTTLITARVGAMPLGELMSNLGRIFDASWEKQGAGWTLTPIPRPEIDHLFMRVGDEAFFDNTLRQLRLAATGEAQTNWGYRMVEAAGLDELQKPKGVLASSLPAQDLAKLRQMMEENAAAELIEYYLPFSPALESDGQLVVQRMSRGHWEDKGAKYVPESWLISVSVSASSFGAIARNLTSFALDPKEERERLWPAELNKFFPPISDVATPEVSLKEMP